MQTYDFYLCPNIALYTLFLLCYVDQAFDLLLIQFNIIMKYYIMFSSFIGEIVH